MTIRAESQIMRGDDPGTIIQFFFKAEKNAAKSKDANRPVHDEFEFIRIMFTGNNSTAVERAVNDTDKERFSTQYRHWKENGEKALGGTPLDALPFMNTAMIADLSYHKVFTVEALAGLSDIGIQQIGMGARSWKDKADEYLRATAADDSGKVKILADENAALKLDLQATQDQLKELARRFEDSLKPKK